MLFRRGAGRERGERQVGEAMSASPPTAAGRAPKTSPCSANYFAQVQFPTRDSPRTFVRRRCRRLPVRGPAPYCRRQDWWCESKLSLNSRKTSFRATNTSGTFWQGRRSTPRLLSKPLGARLSCCSPPIRGRERSARMFGWSSSPSGCADDTPRFRAAFCRMHDPVARQPPDAPQRRSANGCAHAVEPPDGGTSASVFQAGQDDLRVLPGTPIGST